MLTNEQIIYILRNWDIDNAYIEDNSNGRITFWVTDHQRRFSLHIEKSEYIPELVHIYLYRIDENKSIHPIIMIKGISEEIELEFNYILTTRAKEWVREQLNRIFGDKNEVKGFEKLL